MKMKFKKCLVIFFAYLAVFKQLKAETESENCGVRQLQISSRIFGGDDVDDNRMDWPWLVAFVESSLNKFFCAGSLISKRHVLAGKKEKVIHAIKMLDSTMNDFNKNALKK